MLSAETPCRPVYLRTPSRTRDAMTQRNRFFGGIFNFLAPENSKQCVGCAICYLAQLVPGNTAGSNDATASLHVWVMLVFYRIWKFWNVYVVMDAIARTGKRTEGQDLEEEGILGTYGHDELKNNGKRTCWILGSEATRHHQHLLEYAQRWSIPHIQRHQRHKGERSPTFRLHAIAASTPT